VQAQKLHLLLAGIRVKLNRKIPLTVNEENLLAECQRVYHMKPVERVVVDHDGTVHIHSSNDAQPVMEAMKAYGDMMGKKINKSNGARMIGAIDPVTAQIWAKESGLKIGTRAYAQYAKKKLNDIDYRSFRVGG
jgi:hypothetical protein